MPMVGNTFANAIVGMPECMQGDCQRKVARRGGSIESPYCRSHTRAEYDRRLRAGEWFQDIRRSLWEARPRVRLQFVYDD